MFLLPRCLFSLFFSLVSFYSSLKAQLIQPFADGEMRPERGSDLLLQATQSSACRCAVSKNQQSVSTYCVETLKILSG